jgi:hypothetical protein
MRFVVEQPPVRNTFPVPGHLVPAAPGTPAHGSMAQNAHFGRNAQAGYRAAALETPVCAGL